MFDIERVRASWARETAQIDAIVLSMSADLAARPVRDDGWTTQDLLGHIATSAKVFVQFIGSDAPPFGDNVDIHDLNEQQRKRQQQRSWPEVQAYWQRVRDDVTAFLAAGTNDLGAQPARLPWMPTVQTAGDALRLLILHTKSHREELVRGTAIAVEE
ncbi:MAG: DinB family protein [Chloroflexi bacterium]|nr:DinB family protein [Chloroflexota bacterium]